MVLRDGPSVSWSGADGELPHRVGRLLGLPRPLERDRLVVTGLGEADSRQCVARGVTGVPRAI